jgi:pilus assembly protein CpaB
VRYWSLVVGIVAITTLVVHQRATAADRTKAGWGITVEVLVARHDLAPGAPITGDDVQARALPVAMVSQGALTALDPGSVAAERVLAGEVVMRQRLAPAGSGPIAAQLRTEEVGIAVATGPARPEVDVGDEVDLFGISAGDSTGARVAARAVARGRVVAIGEEQITVAIPVSQAPALASTQATAPVMIAVRAHR